MVIDVREFILNWPQWKDTNIKWSFPSDGSTARGTYRFADVDTRFGDRFAGLAVKALRQCWRTVAALSSLEGQLVGHFEGLAKRQDDFIRQVLVSGEKEGGEKGDYIGLIQTCEAAVPVLTTSNAVKTWQ